MSGNLPAVHQFCPAWSPGDPIAESANLVRQALRGLGLQSKIFTDRHTGPVESLARYDPSPDNVLLIHHLNGHQQLEWLLGLPDRKVLFVHPAPASGPATELQESGRRQLGMLRQVVQLAVAPSPRCASELEELGYTVRLM